MTIPYSYEASLENKTVLIAGATGGIGTRTAHRLAAGGARLFLSGRDTAKLRALSGEIAFAASHDAGSLPADLSDPEQAARLVAAAGEHFGAAPDIVINAAGVGAIKSIETLTPADFQSVINNNLLAAMYLSQAAVKIMAPRKSGHLLHIVGILGKAPMANATAYCASKYGLSGFLAALRAEVSRRHNIKITGLYLGGVDTPFYDNPAIEMKVQRDKMLSADDAANTILFALTQPAHLVLGDLTLQPESHQM